MSWTLPVWTDSLRRETYDRGCPPAHPHDVNAWRVLRTMHPAHEACSLHAETVDVQCDSALRVRVGMREGMIHRQCVLARH